MNDVSDCNFQEADMQRIIFATQKTRANIEPPKQTKLGQNYVAMHVLMNQEHQDMMMSEDRTREEKAFMMFKLLAAAGLRRGDEYTYQRLSDILSVHSTTQDERMAYTPKMKWSMKNRTKDDFLDFANCLEAPPSMCRKLPLDCSELKRDHLLLYQNVFGESGPQPCKLRMGEVEILSSSYSVRNEGSSVQSIGFRRKDAHRQGPRCRLEC